MSSTAHPSPSAFDPLWSAEQLAHAADGRLRLHAATLARFASTPSANRVATHSRAARRRMCGGYAPLAALPPFRIG